MIEPKVLAITVIVIAIFCGMVAPLYLTKNFPDRKLLRDTYRASYSLEFEKDEVTQERQRRD
jgi:hypothetical protein